MPYLLAEILNFQGSTHLIGVGSLSKLFIKKEYAGVGAHLFAEAVRQSYENGYDGYCIFEAKTGLIEYYKELVGAKQIGKTQRMYIDEEAAKILYERYYGEKK